MSQLIWIFVWMALGMALRKLVRTPRFVDSLNAFIIWISLPATILLALHRLPWKPSYWIPISMAWIVFILSIAVFVVVGRWQGWSSRTIGALALTAGLGNTSFVGFPLLRALYGEHAISIAILNDQPGSFLTLATLGIYAASYFSAQRQSPAALLARIFKFPPVWATILAVALRPWAYPSQISLALSLGMKTLIPLALISVGAQLEFSKKLFEREAAPIFIGLGYKLIVAPLIITLVFVVLLHHHGQMIRITILEAAMGPMVTGAIVAREYGLDPPLCSLMVSLGIPLCLLSVPAWAYLLGRFGV